MPTLPYSRSRSFAFLKALCLLLAAGSTVSAAVTVAAPASPPTADTNVVFSNFLGLSLELSFINYYFGNSSDQIPQPFIQYLTRLAQHASGMPYRLRLGGNSMDSSTYVPDQQQIIEFTDPQANSNDQPVNFGPQLFAVMKGVGAKIPGGAKHLIGLSLRDPNNPNIALLAGDAVKQLGDDLDGMLLGNEPDLYTAHGNRPGIANYTTDNYIADYQTVFDNLKNTPQGDVLNTDKICGPTICCFWNLPGVLQSGWLAKYSDTLKYITLQHYPTNSCKGAPPFGIEWYGVHANTVSLAKWNEDGVKLAAKAKKPVLMDEFNTVSCGGYPGISDVFGASLWITDYSLQMAVQGYEGAYVHTRESGVTYNVFDPPAGPAGGVGAWKTNPVYYGMLPLAEALEATNGSRVVDLNLENSTTDKKATTAGYAIYDGVAPEVHSLVLINFADANGAPTDYAIDKAYMPEGVSDLTVRFLTAASIKEKTNISYGGKTFAGVGDAVAVSAAFASSLQDQNVKCDGGCTIQVPGPGLAVVFVGGETSATPSQTKANGSTGADSPSQTPPGGNSATRTTPFAVLGLLGTVLCAIVTFM